MKASLDDIAAIVTTSALKIWGRRFAAEIKKLPQEMIEEFRLAYDARLKELEGK